VPAVPIVPELGLGLIALGRPWGHRWQALPSAEQVHDLLSTALALDITFWDTAASYGSSEERIGAFLRSLPAHQAARVTLATKFGDHWTPAETESRRDHSYDALRLSLDRSLRLLPRIHLLQVHRATAEVLREPDLYRALEYARSCGVTAFGASVKDPEAARLALSSGVFSWLQLPYNLGFPLLEPVLRLAFETGAGIVVNRPFGEGRLLDAHSVAAAFSFVLATRWRGYVIPGTQSAAHLRANHQAWLAARQALAK
jgi:aryl-alcohol dehydrogenase-like predicted oxidoreductase